MRIDLWVRRQWPARVYQPAATAGSHRRLEERSMAHIRLIEESEATGEVKAHYDAAVKRAGKVFQIVKSMSPNPRVLSASMRLYSEVMKGSSPLSRTQRELLATVVSRANDCYY
jgi:alkylhydroperoxidase family enzyme